MGDLLLIGRWGIPSHRGISPEHILQAPNVWARIHPQVDRPTDTCAPIAATVVSRAMQNYNLAP